MQRFMIDDRIWTDFPQLVIGVIRFRGINNQQEIPEVIAGLKEEETRMQTRISAGAITEHPHIAAWRDAYRKFGAKPKEYPSSIENLVRRVLKGHALRHINTVVDLYNTISLRHIVPVGGEDLDKISGDVRLVFASDQETPVVMLGETEARSPKPGEVIYKDDQGAICRRWNWKEAERTKFTESSTNGFLVIEGLPPVTAEIVKESTSELEALVRRYCGGVVSHAILDRGAGDFVLRDAE